MNSLTVALQGSSPFPTTLGLRSSLSALGLFLCRVAYATRLARQSVRITDASLRNRGVGREALNYEVFSAIVGDSPLR